MLTMSVDDAVKYGSLLMQQSDRDWDHYMHQMEVKRNQAQQIAEKYYKKEVEATHKEFTGKLTENLLELEGESLKSGEKSAQAFAKGFKNKSDAMKDVFKQLIEGLQVMMDNEMSKIMADAQNKANQAINQAQSMVSSATFNVYGADYGNRGQAMDYGRDLYDSYQREYRRNGGM